MTDYSPPTSRLEDAACDIKIWTLVFHCVRSLQGSAGTQGSGLAMPPKRGKKRKGELGEQASDPPEPKLTLPRGSKFANITD